MNDLHYLVDVLILLIASVFIVVSMNKLKLSPVLGYLVIGAFIGKYSLDLMHDYEYMEVLAEFGVVFLMFVIGLELTFERLIKMRWYVFGFGMLQIILSALIIAHVISIMFKFPTAVNIVVASAMALSSTAIVVQVLNETNRQSTQVGRLSISILLMQDLAVVPLFILLQVIVESGGEGMVMAISWAILKAIITIVCITFIGLLFIRPFFSVISSVKNNEIYVTTALLIVLGAAWITNKLGLSTAMGAFIAGLLIAETEYRYKIKESIMPFQGIFMALFFLTVGMSINIDFIVANYKMILMLSTVFITIKALVIMLLCKLFKFNWGVTINAGLLVSQISEFAFILFNIAAKQNIIGDTQVQLLLMVVAFTMALTPLLSSLGIKIEDKIGMSLDSDQEFKGVIDLSGHVIIAGFGRVGKVVAYVLDQKQVDYIAVDSNASLVRRSRRKGFHIYHGDLSTHEALQAIGAERASAIVLSMDDRSSITKTTRIVSKSFPNLQIIARVEDWKHANYLSKLGLHFAIPTTIETGLQLGCTVLRNLYFPEHEIVSLKDKARGNQYSFMHEVDAAKALKT